MSEAPTNNQADDETLEREAVQEPPPAGPKQPNSARTIRLASGAMITITSPGIDRAFALHRKHQEVFVGEGSGTRYLYALNFLPKTIKIGRFRRKTVWIPEEHILEIGPEGDPWIDDSLLERGIIEPTNFETRIIVFTRLHWWEHVSKQIELAILLCLSAVLLISPQALTSFEPKTKLLLAGGVLMILAVYAKSSTTDPRGDWHYIRLAIIRLSLIMLISAVLLFASAVVTVFSANQRLATLAVITIIIATASLVAWVHWRFKYLILTDRRLMLIYRPPLKLSGWDFALGLVDLEGPLSIDQGLLHNVIGCGTFRAGSAAGRTDKWIEDGIRFVGHHREFYRLVDNAKQVLLAARA